MAYEKRGNGIYYYKKKRDGKRVISTYYGKGEVAFLIVELDEIEADSKDYRQFQEQCRRENAEKFEKELVEIEAAFKDLIAAHFIINGYHQTGSREWRKKGNGRK